MKRSNQIYRIYLIFLTLFFIQISVFGQLVPNGGLEDWYFDTLSIEAESWSSSDMYYQLIGDIPQGCERTTDAYEGQYAMRITTLEIGDDTVSTIVYCNGGTGQYWYENGFAYSQAPAGLRGYFKYNIPVGDTALLYVGLKAGGSSIHTQEFEIWGSSNTYQLLEFPLSAYSGTPDTALFAMTSGDFSNSVPGSWIQFDSLHFYGPGVSQPVPNHDLEDWKYMSSHEPVDWGTSNGMNLGDENKIGVSRSTDSKFGSYSMKIQSQVNYITGDTFSYALTGSVIPGNPPNGGFSYTHQATSFSFWYKYSPTGNDSAIAVVFFTKWNNLTLQADSLGEYMMTLAATPEWTFVDMPVSPSQIPDTALVGFGSTVMESNYFHGLHSTLWVDRCDLHAPTGFAESLNTEAIIYPNPTHDAFRLALQGMTGKQLQVQLISLNGRLIRKWEGAYQADRSYELDGISAGIYLWKVRVEEEVLRGKLVVR